MSDEKIKYNWEIGSDLLRKTLKDMDLTTLDALSTSLLTLRVVLNFLGEKQLALELAEFLKQQEDGFELATIFFRTTTLLEEFHGNVMKDDRLT